RMTELKFVIILLSFCVCISSSNGKKAELEEFYRWKQLSFKGLPLDKNHNSSDPFLVTYNNVPMSVSHYKGKLFITVPRRAPGIPSVLYYIPDDLPAGSSPSLKPYPDYKTNELHPEQKPDKKRIVSIYRTRVDDCGKLWFVCTGALEQNGVVQVQPPSIWIIDLETDSVIRRYEIPKDIVEQGRGIISLKIDVQKDKCHEAHAYISDFLHQKIYVYSFEKNRMWSFSHFYLNYEPEFTKFDFDGFKYQWFDGVFSVTLAKRNADGFRRAFFHPMSSNSEFEVSTRTLQNETVSTIPEAYKSHFVKLGNRGPLSQSTLHDFDDKTGSVFFALIAKSAVSCWNSKTLLTPESQGIVAQDDHTMNYPVDLSVYSGTVWTLTNTLPRFIYGKLDTNEYNFRILRGNTKELIKGTVCEPKHFAHGRKVEHDNHEQDVVFPGDIFHEMSEDNEEFIPYNNVPMSVAHYKDKLIITVPRRKPGIPSTLNYVSTNLPQGSSPSLRPYPDAKTNKLHV
ncbi:L-dopachrome tautomerase yellow-f, partial [Pseudolycoriella hygida]